MSPDPARDEIACRCTQLTGQTPWEPAAWEQADDCPVHPLAAAQVGAGADVRDEAAGILMRRWGVQDDDQDAYDAACADWDALAPHLAAQVAAKDAEIAWWQRQAFAIERAHSAAIVARDAALAKVDAARRDARTALEAIEQLCDEALIEQVEAGFGEVLYVAHVLPVVRAAIAAVESPDQPEGKRP